VTVSHHYPRSEVVYLHLKPGRYSQDLTVTKLAKSNDTVVEPGTVIVKAKITVPAGFFAEAIPFAEVEFMPGDVVQPTITTEESQ
jgi:hypothetical protein